MNFTSLRCLALAVITGGFAGAARGQSPPNGSQLFQNLRQSANSWNVDNPAVASEAGNEGPKGLAAADFDGDGLNDLATASLDGSISVLFGLSGGGFLPPRFLTSANHQGLRDVIAAQISGDPRPEIIAANPFDGTVSIHAPGPGTTGRTFGEPVILPTWPGARSVAAGDFDGDGRTDLVIAGAGDGLREFRGSGTGTFTRMEPVSAIAPGPPRTDNNAVVSAKPVFALQTWRRPGENRDRLAVTFAGAGYIWLLAAPAPGQPLAVAESIPLLPEESIYDLTMAFVSAESRSSGEPDLISAATWSGEIFLRQFQPGTQAPHYTTAPQVRLAVPGAPRAVTAADVNADTWPELIVASRTGNSVSLYKNDAGRLSLHSESPAGASPREIAAADFDGNGRPDAAVINRASGDVTVHRIDPATAWFYGNPLVQRIPGGGRALSIVRIFGSLRAQLLYLNRSTSDAVILSLNTGSRWAAPVRLPMQPDSRTLQATDLNGDSLPDLLATSAGNPDAPAGFSWRLQNQDRTFGPLQSAILPDHPLDSIRAAVAGDFNGDALPDLAVAAFQSARLLFFEGTGSGFEFRRSEPAGSGAVALKLADLDQDGTADLIATGSYGEITVIRNDGQWFAGAPLLRFSTSSAPEPGTYGIDVSDLDGDGDPDLTVLSQHRAATWSGSSGILMENQQPATLPFTLSAASADYDGDGIPDAFALHPSVTTVSFFRGSANNSGRWWTATPEAFPVPSATELATGDLDGDGRPDLAAIGDHLWAALSATPAPPATPQPRGTTAPDLSGVLINELLASVSDFIPPGAGKPMDCVEIYNSGAIAADLSGWTLAIDPPPGETPKPPFVFPAVTLPPGGFHMIYCSGLSGPQDAPFKLPASGGTLRLRRAAGSESDAVTWPEQRSDMSWARVFDGSRTFAFNPYPAPGSPNHSNGSAPPEIEFRGADTALLTAGSWRLRARAWADGGVASVTLYWRELADNTSPASGVVPLHDDGLNGDTAPHDGEFSGVLTNPPAPGTAVEFYLTVTDQRWQSTTIPDAPQFTGPGVASQNFAFAIPAAVSPWEISEVVSKNHTGLTDETGNTPDWAEVRNAGLSAEPLAGLVLADSLFDRSPGKQFDLARLGSAAASSTALIVLLDGLADSGANPAHAPFRVSNDGDTLYLLRRLPSGAAELLDFVRVPPLAADTAFARLGARGPFILTDPTPGGPNAPPGGIVHIISGPDNSREALFAYPGPGRLEAASTLGSWLPLQPPAARSDIEHVWREPARSSRFFRIRLTEP